MAFTPRGTLARKAQESGLNETVLAQAACPHSKPPRIRGDGIAVLCDYICTDCGKTLRSYYREVGRWVRVGGEET